jgi:hydroxymethylglutaryl-CoA lyase
MSEPATAVPEGAHITVCEVGPRDGFQIETAFIPTHRKVAIVNALLAAGLKHIQVTSFVSPRAVPQLADAEEVLSGIDRPRGAVFSALVPNARGAARAAAAKVDEIHLVCSASDTHNRKNLNRPTRDTLAGFHEVMPIAREAGIEVAGGIATAFGCPFEGDVPPDRLVEIARTYRDEFGVRHVGLGDTTGMATPNTVRAALRALRAQVPDVAVGLHFHNTRGVGLACVMVGLAEGVTHYDASVGGLGGCPFAAGATGNICTEDLVYLLQESGYRTGVDLEKLIEAAKLTERVIGRELPGQVMKSGHRLDLHPVDAVATAAG